MVNLLLIQQTVNVKWNAKTKKHYEQLGYTFTKMGDSFIVKCSDLTDGSNVRVTIRCDYCGRLYDISWYSYKLLKKKQNNRDCCGDSCCTYAKSQESLMLKYYVNNARFIENVNDKIKETCLEKYGVENPFQAQEVKSKIAKTNLEKYGYRYPMQNPEIKNKTQKTCMERYGVPMYSKTKLFRERFSGKNSPTWNGGLAKLRTERSSIEYRDWRKAVFAKDFYKCQCCGAKSSHKSHVELHAHHIKNWADNEADRYSVDNGITLCDKCHYEFHSLFGKKNNDSLQLASFLQMKRYAEPMENEPQESQDKKPVR